MDRYDRVIRDIQQKTGDDRIAWKVESPASFGRILVNADRILRVNWAEYDLGGRPYRLLFVERKTEVPDDFGDIHEGFGFELLVLDHDGEIVLALYDGVVERDDLLKLAGLIDEHNDRARTFFAAFDESGAA